MSRKDPKLLEITDRLVQLDSNGMPTSENYRHAVKTLVEEHGITKRRARRYVAEIGRRRRTAIIKGRRQ